MATTAAQAAPKFTICHKPGAANQQILMVGEKDLQKHQAHGDHQVTTEVCNGIDDDCDGAVDDECIATCPDACAAALGRAAGHEYESHTILREVCTYDVARQAGAVVISLSAPHNDIVDVSDNECFVRLNGIDDSVLRISNAEQKACAPIAAQVVEDITLEECNIDPPPPP